MSKRITLTLPDNVAESLSLKGAVMGISGAEFLKQRILLSVAGEDLPLKLQPLVQALSGALGVQVLEQVDLPLMGEPKTTTGVWSVGYEV